MTPDRIPPLVTAAAMASICILTAWIGRPPQTSALRKPIEGTLFSIDADTAAATSQAAQPAARPAARESYPEVRLSLDPAARARFPGGADFLIHIVGPEAAYVALILARHQPARAFQGKTAKNTVFTAKKPLASHTGLPIETREPHRQMRRQRRSRPLLPRVRRSPLKPRPRRSRPSRSPIRSSTKRCEQAPPPRP